MRCGGDVPKKCSENHNGAVVLFCTADGAAWWRRFKKCSENHTGAVVLFCKKRRRVYNDVASRPSLEMARHGDLATVLIHIIVVKYDQPDNAYSHSLHEV